MAEPAPSNPALEIFEACGNIPNLLCIKQIGGGTVEASGTRQILTAAQEIRLKMQS
jgi:hypothetical protein